MMRFWFGVGCVVACSPAEEVVVMFVAFEAVNWVDSGGLGRWEYLALGFGDGRMSRGNGLRHHDDDDI